MLCNSRIRTTVHVDFTLYVDLLQFQTMIAIVELITLPSVPFKFEYVLILHFASLAVVQDHHNLAVLLLLFHRLLLMDQQMLL